MLPTSTRLVVSLARVSACVAHQQRVVGGDDDENGLFPFAVTLESNFIRFPRVCSGSLVTLSWVLTAAHCLKPRVVRIRYGDFTKRPKKTKKFRKVISMSLHPSYRDMPLDGDHQRYDIGLVHVKPVPPHALAKLGAIDYRTLFGHNASLAGFSYIDEIIYDEDSKQMIFEEYLPLQVLEVVMTRCSTDSFKICVQGDCIYAVTVVPGDSGGPLMYLYDGLVVAVASTMNDEVAGTYTPVSPYIIWIQETINSQRD